MKKGMNSKRAAKLKENKKKQDNINAVTFTPKHFPTGKSKFHK